MSHQQAGPDREPARRFIAADHARAASPYANVSSAVHKTLPVARRTAMCQRRKNVIAGPLRSAVRWTDSRIAAASNPGLRKGTSTQRWANSVVGDRGLTARGAACPGHSEVAAGEPFTAIAIDLDYASLVKILQFRRIPGTSPSRYQTAPGACTARRGTQPDPGHHSGSVT
jgi:hypothetical protein